MIRIIIDKLGRGHNDLILKIDAIPSYSVIADSYYLFDFLEISDFDLKKLNLKEDETLKFGIVELLNYWTERIRQIEKGQMIFIPFDLCDEYIGGLMLKKNKLGFKIQRVYTEKINGYGVRKSNLDKQINDNEVHFIKEVQTEWIMAEEALFNGFDWSIKELTN